MELKTRMKLKELRDEIKSRDRELKNLREKVEKYEQEIYEKDFRIRELSYLISKGLENVK